MGQIQNDARRGLAHRVDHRLKGLGLRFIIAFQRRGGGEQRQMLAALDQQPVEQHVVQALGRGQRVGDALGGLLVEIQAHGAERQVEIDHRGVDMQLLGDAPADIVRQGGGAGTATGADKGHHPADRARRRIEIKAGDRLDDLQRRQRCHQIFRGAAAHQFAVQLHVIDAADHHHLGGGIAHFGQAIEFVQRISRPAAWSRRSGDWA